jgi:hypothetical protein
LLVGCRLQRFDFALGLLGRRLGERNQAHLDYLGGALEAHLGAPVRVPEREREGGLNEGATCRR